MTATFEGVASGVEDTPVSSWTVDYPSGTVEGDLVIVCITRDLGSSFTFPAGWTKQGALGSSTAEIWSRIAPASPGSGFTVTMTSNGDVAWVSLRFSGAAESTIALGASASNSSRPPEIKPGALVEPTGGPDLFWVNVALGTGAIALTGYPSGYPNGQATASFTAPLFSRNETLGVAVSDLVSTKPTGDQWTSTGNDQWYCRGFYLMPKIVPTGFATANDVETPVLTVTTEIDPPDDPVIPPVVEPPGVATGGGLKWSPGCTCCFVCPPIHCVNQDLTLTQASMTVEGFSATFTKDSHAPPLLFGAGVRRQELEPIGKWVWTWEDFDNLNHTISTTISAITNQACSANANASCPNMWMQNKVTNLGQVVQKLKYVDLSPASSWGTCSDSAEASLTWDVYSILGHYTLNSSNVPVAVSNAVNGCGWPTAFQADGFQRWQMLFVRNAATDLEGTDDATGPQCPGTTGAGSFDPDYNDRLARWIPWSTVFDFTGRVPYHYADTNADINTSTNLIEASTALGGIQRFWSECWEGFGTNRKRTLIIPSAGQGGDGAIGVGSYFTGALGIPGYSADMFYGHNWDANCPGDLSFDCSDPDNYSEYENDEIPIGWNAATAGSSYVSGPRCYWTFT